MEEKVKEKANSCVNCYVVKLMKALSLKVYSFALTSLPNGFSHLSAFLYFKSFWNNQMHCEIIDCYFSIFFVELKLKRENLKNVFGHQSMSTLTCMLISQMAYIHH